jgi:hypothetical protein
LNRFIHHAKSSSFYTKWRQVKTEWGVSRREGERERDKQIKGERETELMRESKMTWIEK